MKKVLKILIVLLWIALTGGLIYFTGFANIEHDKVVCNRYDIQIDYGNADTLVTSNDIYDLVKRTGNLLKGQKTGNIDIEKIEREIRRQPYVADVNAFMHLNGDVEIRIIQRQPILRIFNHYGESYYLDGQGRLLPLNPAFTTRVLVATGFIPESFSKTVNYKTDSIQEHDSTDYNGVMNHLYRISIAILKNSFLKAQIEQIYVTEDGNFELIPVVGRHVIYLGDAQNLEEKFDKLIVFYKMGLNKIGWNKYNFININYKNQVVCSKR
ncbi:MAG: hypothetical protein Q8867_08750 [Bacteroidota bacterium]|nr:hypothetical protein [Bacteroidota bacterium]